ncbi:aminoacyl-tRNA hydrolase [Natronospora cellulosivora (SeqCode)]
MYLIVGLGNPGRKYSQTRHNVGFMAISKLSEAYKIKSTSNKFKAVIAQGRLNGEKVILAEPLTYMNNSGEAVKLIVDYYNIPISNVIIIYDDMDLPLGKIRLKTKGSDGGHKGLRSIISCLNSRDVPRIRIGIDSPPANFAVPDYVLSRFNKEEQEIIDDSLVELINLVREIINNGYQKAMNKFN